jgi:uncharacterized protein (TIGR03435 family)
MIVRLLFAVAALATFADAQPAFEVASIKQNTSGDRWESVSKPAGGRFTVKNATVAWLVRTAYRVEPFQVTGLPPWASSERYDVVAKAADPDATLDQMRQMLQTLLAARFQMSSHREMKPQPVFALVVAKNGPKLARAKTDTCTDSTMARPCGGFRIANRSSMWGDTVTVKQLAGELTYMMQRMVLDKTGIQGLYDIKITWTPEHFGPEPGAEVKPDEANATLFTSIQEQLGLKLQSEKAPVETIVVYRVSRPVEN